MQKETKSYSGKSGFEILKTEHFGIQRKIVANMTTESWETIPHACYLYEPDVTEFIKEFQKQKDSKNYPIKISLNTLMLKVITEGIKKNPEVNAHIEYKRRFVKGKVEVIKDINISMPMTLPNGEMMTINLHNFEDKTLEEMTAYIEDMKKKIEKTVLTQAMFDVSMDNTLSALKKMKFITTFGRLLGAKTGKHRVKTLTGKAKKDYERIPVTERLTKQDIEQGTVTISNVGSLYHGVSKGTITLLEIIPPQVFAIGISALTEKPGVYVDENGEKQIGIRQFMPMCLAFDHRALDYGDVIPFIKRLDEIFENPSEIQNW